MFAVARQRNRSSYQQSMTHLQSLLLHLLWVSMRLDLVDTMMWLALWLSLTMAYSANCSLYLVLYLLRLCQYSDWIHLKCQPVFVQRDLMMSYYAY